MQGVTWSLALVVALCCAPSRAASVAVTAKPGEFTEEQLKEMCKKAAETESEKDVVEIVPHHNLAAHLKINPFDIIHVGVNTPVICLTSMVAKAIILKNPKLKGTTEEPSSHEISLEFQSGKKLSDYGDQTLGHYQGFKNRKEQSAAQGDTDADVGTVKLYADIRRPAVQGEMAKKKGKEEKVLEKIEALVAGAGAVANGETKLAEIEAASLKKDGDGYAVVANAMETRIKAIEEQLVEIKEKLEAA